MKQKILPAILVALILISIWVVWKAKRDMDLDNVRRTRSAVSVGKQARDYQLLQTQLYPLLSRWQRSRPSVDKLAAYDVTLLIDLPRGVVAMQQGGHDVETFTLPGGHNWKVRRGAKNVEDLGQRVRLKMRGARGQRNLCQEAFSLYFAESDGRGICIEIRSSSVNMRSITQNSSSSGSTGNSDGYSPGPLASIDESLLVYTSATQPVEPK